MRIQGNMDNASVTNTTTIKSTLAVSLYTHDLSQIFTFAKWSYVVDRSIVRHKEDKTEWQNTSSASEAFIKVTNCICYDFFSHFINFLLFNNTFSVSITRLNFDAEVWMGSLHVQIDSICLGHTLALRNLLCRVDNSPNSIFSHLVTLIFFRNVQVFSIDKNC